MPVKPDMKGLEKTAEIDMRKIRDRQASIWKGIIIIYLSLLWIHFSFPFPFHSYSFSYILLNKEKRNTPKKDIEKRILFFHIPYPLPINH